MIIIIKIYYEHKICISNYFSVFIKIKRKKEKDRILCEPWYFKNLFIIQLVNFYFSITGVNMLI